MTTTEECKCIDSLISGIINSGMLEDMTPEVSPSTILDMARELKEDIDRMEQFCTVPPKGSDFFMPHNYREAKDNLRKTFESNGTNKSSAKNAGIGMSAFLLSNASKMVKCPKIKY